MSNTSSRQNKHFFWCWPCSTLNLSVNTVQMALTVFSLATRLINLSAPHSAVFDELYFIRYVSFYMNRTFFFDSNPPLGTMFVALGGWFAGFDGYYGVDRIGDDYPATVPVWGLRLVPAILGSLIVPVAYQIMLEMDFTKWTAALVATTVIFENALLTQSRLILMDSPFIFMVMVTVMSERKFNKASKICPWSFQWWMWLLCLSLSGTAAVCMKYVGIFTSGLVLCRIAHDYWHLIPQLTLNELYKHLVVRFCFLLVLPVIVYVSIFFIHLRILVKSGPHDDIMTSAFQASLQGGLSSITHGQPSLLTYGSQVTLRRTYGTACWLHSHELVYPLQYDDGRGSSHQQQVSCYSFKDVNNWWIVKRPHSNRLTVSDPVEPIRNGDIIQLLHGMTRRPLHSHDVAAPMSPQHQEVSCYIDYNISAPEQSLWQVILQNEVDTDNRWLAIKSYIQLVHVNTSHVLKTSGNQLGTWGYRQLEVVADRSHNQLSAVWNVEEHEYPRSPDEQLKEEDSANGHIPLGFLGKFWELQLKLLTPQQDTSLEHIYSSDPLEWPLLGRNIIYWFHPTTNAQIHFIGNPVVWLTAVVSIVMYPLLLTFYVLKRRRRCYDIPEDVWQQYSVVGQVVYVGYIFHYLPYFLMERTFFLYHYLPALMFSILILGATVEHIGHLIQMHWPKLMHVYIITVITWLTYAGYTFVRFGAVSYGQVPLSNYMASELQWFNSWDFILQENS